MAKILGKFFKLKLESDSVPGQYNIVANCRSNSLVHNNEVIDVTDKDGMPWRELLPGGVQSLESSVAGIYTDAATQKQVRLWAQDNAIRNCQLVDGFGNVIQCGFQLQNFEHSGEYNKEQLFTGKLASTGTPVFTNV